VYDASAPYLALQNSSTGTAAGDGFQIQMAGLHGYVFNYENGDLYLGAGGATRITAKSDGKVGIGTSSPNSKLEVATSANVNSYSDGAIQVVSSSPLAFVAPSNLNPSLNRWGFTLREGGEGHFGIRDYRHSSTRVTIDDNGNVAIGTTNPLADGLTIRREGSGKQTLLQLDRPNTAGLQTNIKFSVANIMVGQIQHEYASSNYNHMSFTLRDPGGADVIPLWLQNSGNVGIGTTAPVSKLQVLGAVASGTATKPTHAVYDASGNMKSFEHVFSATKGTTSGAINKTLVDVSGLSNFHQAIFIVEYGTRLQAVTDSTTGFVHRVYALNRFNGGNLNVTETTAIAGSSNSLAHALIDVEIVSNTQYRIRVEFSSSVGSSSFASGTIRAYGLSDYFPTISFAEGMGNT